MITSITIWYAYFGNYHTENYFSKPYHSFIASTTNDNVSYYSGFVLNSTLTTSENKDNFLKRYAAIPAVGIQRIIAFRSLLQDVQTEIKNQKIDLDAREQQHVEHERIAIGEAEKAEKAAINTPNEPQKKKKKKERNPTHGYR